MIQHAAKIAKRSTHHQHHHACLVVRGGAIIAVDSNQGDVHAEVGALSKLWPSERRGVKVYSFRFTKDGRPAMAKPCKKCEVYMRALGVKVVYYSDRDGSLARMKL